MFNYSKALELMKEGELVRRTGWNGKGMFIFFRPQGEKEGSVVPVETIPFCKINSPECKRLSY